MTDFPSSLDPNEHPWLVSKPLHRIFDTLKAGGGEARAVGGAVRDTLLGRMVDEVDLAVNLAPDRVMTILEEAHIKVVPTGFDHGTVTAVLDHKGYEITTLRKDIETFGRHARVAFTDDWQADAARRDFTFNALYADANGKVYDYFAGREDLKMGRVRFIGDARARIKEDVLRILRFFRFFAWFGKGTPDGEALAACQALAPLLPTLSAERVWREISKLLGADNPLPAWKMMRDTTILMQTVHEATNLSRLEALLEVEKKYDVETSSLVRFAALLAKDKNLALSVAKSLKLSNREGEKLQVLALLPDRLRGKLDPVPFRRALYQYGAEDARDAALLLATEDQSADLMAALGESGRWEKPSLPVQGEDVLKLGLPPGPRVGDLLRAVEEWWLMHDFRPTRVECLDQLKRRARS